MITVYFDRHPVSWRADTPNRASKLTEMKAHGLLPSFNRNAAVRFPRDSLSWTQIDIMGKTGRACVQV